MAGAHSAFRLCKNYAEKKSYSLLFVHFGFPEICCAIRKLCALFFIDAKDQKYTYNLVVLERRS